MADDFSDFNDDSFDDTPDWLLDEEGEVFDATDTGAGVEEGDEFEQLRRKSARTGSMYDDMESGEEVQTAASSSSFSWSSFSSGQRLVLALLIVLDILAIAFGIMVITNII